MKEALKSLVEDLLSTIAFLVLFALTGNALLTTAVAIAVGAAQIAFELWRRKPIAVMQWLSLALVMIFGGASLLTHDNRFIMLKPTLIYAAVGTAMLKPGWLDRYMPEIVHANAPRSLIVGSGFAWSLMMFALGIGNLAIAWHYDRSTWAAYNSVVPIAAKLGAIAAQYLLLRTVVRRRLRRAAIA